MEKERPSAWKLGFFLMNHTEKELEDLPAGDKLACIDQVYEKQFLTPIVTLLAGAIERAECRNATDRRSRKFLEATEILDNAGGADDSIQERVKRVAAQIVEIR